MTALLERLAMWWDATATSTKIAYISAAAAVLVVGTVWLT
jgi:hypothetical protein